LIETSPNIPEKIVEQFKVNFNKNESFGKIIKPEVCDILLPTSDYRNPWFNEENQTKIVSEQLKQQITKQNKIKKQNELHKKFINDFIKLFTDLNNREPMESEIIDNLKDKINPEIIKKIIDENKSMTLSIKVNNNSNNSIFNMV
jgi:hypothetical protein